MSAEDIEEKPWSVQSCVNHIRRQLERMGIKVVFTRFEDGGIYEEDRGTGKRVILISGYLPKKALIVSVRFSGNETGVSDTQFGCMVTGELVERPGVLNGDVHEEFKYYGSSYTGLPSFTLSFNNGFDISGNKDCIDSCMSILRSFLKEHSDKLRESFSQPIRYFDGFIPMYSKRHRELYAAVQARRLERWGDSHPFMWEASQCFPLGYFIYESPNERH